MFTQTQLEQLRQVIREEVRNEIAPVKQLQQEQGEEISSIRIVQQKQSEEISNIRITQQKHEKKLNSMQRTLKRAVREISFIVKDFDERIVANKREIDKLKEYSRVH